MFSTTSFSLSRLQTAATSAQQALTSTLEQDWILLDKEEPGSEHQARYKIVNLTSSNVESFTEYSEKAHAEVAKLTQYLLEKMKMNLPITETDLKNLENAQKCANLLTNLANESIHRIQEIQRQSKLAQKENHQRQELLNGRLRLMQWDELKSKVETRYKEMQGELTICLKLRDQFLKEKQQKFDHEMERKRVDAHQKQVEHDNKIRRKELEARLKQEEFERKRMLARSSDDESDSDFDVGYSSAIFYQQPLDIVYQAPPCMVFQQPPCMVFQQPPCFSFQQPIPCQVSYPVPWGGGVF